MKKSLSIFGATVLLAGLMSSCMDDNDSPINLTPSSVGVTAPSGSLPEPTTTIYKLKRANASTLSQTNAWTYIKKNVVFEGIVCANDVSGNLYQNVMLRHIDEEGHDASILLSIKNSCLYPYFPLGQKVRVNLKGLYLGTYSYAPTIGQPYWTSVITTGSATGNYRLGPMLFELCKSNIELIGEPNPEAPELVPMDLTTTQGQVWLANNANKSYQNCPILAKIKGYIKEAHGVYADIAEVGEYLKQKEPMPKIFAPEVLEDQGYCVDRTIVVKQGLQVSIRTATQNEIAFTPLPADTCNFTGFLNYYSDWQIHLRDLSDLEILNKK